MSQLQPEATGALYGAQGGFGFGSGPTQTAGGPWGTSTTAMPRSSSDCRPIWGRSSMTPENGYTTRQKITFYIRGPMERQVEAHGFLRRPV